MHFLTKILPWDSTNGLQSRARKWLVALTTFVFALSTVYWILSVVFTFSSLDTFGSTVAGCFKSNDAASCLTPKLELLESELRTPVPAMLGILYINVSIVLCRVLAQYPYPQVFPVN